MPRYSERFKKEVARKVLTPGISMKAICQKLNISSRAVRDWRKKYAHEVQAEAEDKVLSKIQPVEEEEVDIDKLLAEADRQDLSREKLNLEETIDKIIAKSKVPSDYNLKEKYAILNKVRSLRREELGVFFRRAGLHSQHIKLWEDEILAMGKKEIDKSDYIKNLEEENKKLNKKLKELERDKRELQVLIELKKKYSTLFKEDGED